LGADGAVVVQARGGDDGLPNGSLQVHWRVQQAPEGGDAVFADAAALQTSVRFTRAGQYTLRLVANDGALMGHADVQVNAPASRPLQRHPVAGNGQCQCATHRHAVPRAGLERSV
ncbi:hypothetical protein, partial [Curtobacterium oceanosedimentum]|uniref:hypothetical protein n=1 Tax=Curtobacterium oceanosedimentum TaxID=465820 RepID=UPI001BDE1AF0